MTKQKLGPLQKEFIRCLRSGKFVQGRYSLFPEVIKSGKHEGEYKHCCLGVACCVAEANKTFLSPDILVKSCLPYNVIKKLKFFDTFGSLKEPIIFKGDNCYYLSELNDKGMSFKKIADLIETNPSNFFKGEA